MKIFWFQKKANDEYFPIDTEKQASDLFKRRDFNQKFKYIGWSDGRKYNQIVSQKKKLTKKEFEKMALAGDDLDQERTDLLKLAFEEELKVAKRNKDKTQPRNFDVADLEGNPMEKGTMADMVKLMGNR